MKRVIETIEHAWKMTSDSPLDTALQIGHVPLSSPGWCRSFRQVSHQWTTCPIGRRQRSSVKLSECFSVDAPDRSNKHSSFNVLRSRRHQCGKIPACGLDCLLQTDLDTEMELFLHLDLLTTGLTSRTRSSRMQSDVTEYEAQV